MSSLALARRGNRNSLGWPLSIVSSIFLFDSVQGANRAFHQEAAFMHHAQVGGGGLWRGHGGAVCPASRSRRGFAAPPPSGGVKADFLRTMQRLRPARGAAAGRGEERDMRKKQVKRVEEEDMEEEGENFGEANEALKMIEPGHKAEKEFIDILSEGGKFDPNERLQAMIDEMNAGNKNEESKEYTFTGPKRCGTVAIVGAPNAGKSTLLNRLIGSKLAIVTHKRQTTRNSVTGIAMEDGTQVIYIDTPGIMDARPGHRLNRAMVKNAWNAARDADEIFFIVDADKILPGRDGRGVRGTEMGQNPADVVPKARLFLREDTNEALVLRRLCERHQDFNLVLNKVDQVRGDRKGLLLPLAEAVKEQAMKQDSSGTYVKKVYAVSAMNGKGTEPIREYLKKSLPLSEWLYPPDQISDIPMRNIAAEITRESIILRAHEEVPYAAYVETESFQEQANGSVRIEQQIFVQTEGQKRIIVGMLKDLGIRSRREIGKFLQQEVHLFLTVKVKKWDESQAMFERIGLEFDA